MASILKDDNGRPLYTTGTRRIMDAMKDADVSRLIVISASFVETMDRGPIWFRLPAAIGLKRVFDQMKEMEHILADEPTGNLDPDTSDRVFAALLDLVRETGLSALIATHNLDLAARMDRKVRLDGGVLTEG